PRLRSGLDRTPLHLRASSATSAGQKPSHSSVAGAIDVDATGQIRGITLTLHTSAADGATGATTDLHEVMQFTDFGTPVTVTAPPADQVVQDSDSMNVSPAVKASHT